MEKEIQKQISNKFTKFVVDKSFEDIEDIKTDFCNMYDNQFGYHIIQFYDEVNLARLFII